MHAFLDELLGLLEELAGHEHDGGGAITDLVILRLGNVDEGLGSGVHNIEERNQSGTVVGDGDASAVMDEFVHTTGSESSLNDIDDSLASVDVRDDLSLS